MTFVGSTVAVLGPWVGLLLFGQNRRMFRRLDALERELVMVKSRIPAGIDVSARPEKPFESTSLSKSRVSRSGLPSCSCTPMAA